MRAGETTADGKLGVFQQRLASDCFFLSGLIALAQDSDGQALLETVIRKGAEPGSFEVVFPNQADTPVVVKQDELDSHRLASASGKQLTAPTSGDPDVRMLEIEIDFASREFVYLDPVAGTDKLHKDNLDRLFEGLANGSFAINYLEVPSP